MAIIVNKIFGIYCHPNAHQYTILIPLNEKIFDIMELIVCMQPDVVITVHLHKISTGPGRCIQHCIYTNVTCYALYAALCL
jgi:hypothetical protein